MFSYFNGGIKNINPKRHIDLPTLVRLIKKNPEKLKIEKIRELRRNGKKYKALKDTLPNVTPNCMVRVRKLKDAEYNLIALSSYFYFDIDDYPNSQQLKDRFILEYGHLASLICISPSSGGITIIFKVSNLLKTENDFLVARQYIIDNILINVKYDTNAEDIARAMFISSDPELFYNYENELDIPVELFKKTVTTKEKKCRLKDKNPLTGLIPIYCAPQEHFIPIPIKEVLEQLIFETPVQVDNPIVDFKEVKFVEIRFKYLIKDGLKHKTFTGMIHKLMFLNPNADRQLLLSYLYHVNNEYTGNKKMELKRLINLFDFVYNNEMFLGNSDVKQSSLWMGQYPSCFFV